MRTFGVTGNAPEVDELGNPIVPVIKPPITE
jgi:hypothetical protein